MEASERPGLVLVDFDDTLVDTGPIFHAARADLFDLLVANGFSYEDIHQTHHDEVEVELIASWGFGPFRLEASFRETYRRLAQKSGRAPDPELEERVASLAAPVMATPRLLPGALEALERLAQRVRSVIYSQAARHDFQLDRIQRSGAAALVPNGHVRVTPRKTEEAFQEVLAAFQVQHPRQAIMIGNSVRSDLNPALNSGAQAILVQTTHTWHHDAVEPAHADFATVPSFHDAVELLFRRWDL